ncbi:FKBP-type peptidylprolyl isomerase [Flavobacterium sp.]|uniref:FKBP-type peptidylprolyl isomerase n=1 Tax=Flavobacterium sp. TaxID=239 RepID=UPI00260AC3B5|nr:FKBP-type peptidylprolyl isomerase [Flavobacterium sp.]
MNKFKFYFFLFCSVSILFSCNKSDSVDEVPVRDFDVQYQDDMDMIEDYLNTHYITLENQEIKMSKIDNGQTKMMDLLSVPDGSFPQLRKKTVEYNDKTYQIYYIKYQADNTNPNAVKPSRVDGVLAAYRGTYLNYTTKKVNDVSVTTLNATLFEYTPFPSDFLTLDNAVRGWREIFPFFKEGNKTVVDGEPTSYADFGLGVVFIPSGFAYFNVGRTSSLSGVTIPSYSPLVFTFKLYEVKAADQDSDGVISNIEDLNHDGLFTNDDTDGDGVQNLYDSDDDGDGYYTFYEIHKNTDGTIIFEDDDNDGIPNYLDPDRPEQN